MHDEEADETDDAFISDSDEAVDSPKNENNDLVIKLATIEYYK